MNPAVKINQIVPTTGAVDKYVVKFFILPLLVLLIVHFNRIQCNRPAVDSALLQCNKVDSASLQCNRKKT